MSLIVSSTTDSQEAVNLAAGLDAGEATEESTESTPAGQYPPGSQPHQEPDPDEEEEEEEEPEEPEPAKEPPPPKRKGGYQRKIEALERERGYMQRRIEEYESQLAGQRKPAGETREPQGPMQRPEPTQDQFNSYEEFVDARMDWKLEQRELALAKQAREWHAKEQERQAMSSWQQRVGDYKQQAADFDDVLAATDYIQIPPVLQQALMKSANGPQLAYALAKEPNELQRIASLDGLDALLALGEFKAKLSAPAAVEKPKPAVSKAPEPIKPVGQGATTSTKRPDEMSFAEYKAWRNKQIAASKRRAA